MIYVEVNLVVQLVTLTECAATTPLGDGSFGDGLEVRWIGLGLCRIVAIDVQSGRVVKAINYGSLCLPSYYSRVVGRSSQVQIWYIHEAGPFGRCKLRLG